MEKAIYRPELHFTAKHGWINDPNGLIFENGRYHLFYQHYPNATQWGPMYWGHAVTEDLLHWQHLPLALAPDDLGYAFSGSAAIDRNNISGFGKKGKAPMILMYTSHNMMTNLEQQSIAYSTDYIHFEKYKGNPVIKGTPGLNMRDPQIFYNPYHGGYSMALAVEEEVVFYKTENFLQWEETGRFHAGEHGLKGICECPDCFPIETEEGTKWILIVSMIIPPAELRKNPNFANRVSHITQYYVGDFDGETFVDTECAEEPLLVDYGTDNYAAVSFSGLSKPMIIGWADNWDYANQSPPEEEGFQGKMTLSRNLKLVKTAEGYRLASSFAALENIPAETSWLKSGVHPLDRQSFGLKLHGMGTVTFRNSKEEKLIVRIEGKQIIIDRSQAGKNEFSDIYSLDRCSRIGIERKITSIGADPSNAVTEFVFDHCILEVMADDGLLPATVNVYPEYAYEQICLEGGLEGEIYAVPV